MKKITGNIIILSLLISNNAVLGIPVTDVGSYSYYVEQIEKATSMISEMEKQSKTMGGTLSEVQNMKKQVVGNYNRVMGALDDAKRASAKLSKTKPAIDNVLDINNTSGGNNGNGLFKNANDFLDKIFTDPRYRKTNVSPDAINLLQHGIRQRSLKTTITTAENILKQNGKRLKNIKKLAAAIDKTENIKDSQDLTNRFLYEILAVNIELLTIMTAFSQSEALSKYSGYDRESETKALEEYEKNKKPKFSAFDKMRNDARKGREIYNNAQK